MASVAVEYAHLVNDKVRLSDVQPLIAHINIKDVRQDVARQLVAALHKSVRYTGVEFGESSLVPQYPGETLKRKYGDCKDKATLLVAMLRAAGLPANLALLSTGPGQDINPELPGMGLFDHAIVYVPAAGVEPELWIDATAQYSRIGVLPLMDYGRLALVVDEKTTALKKIPELNSTENITARRASSPWQSMVQPGLWKLIPKMVPWMPITGAFTPEMRKNCAKTVEKYVKGTYLADSMISFTKSDPADLEKPFTLKNLQPKAAVAFVIVRMREYISTPSILRMGCQAYFETREDDETAEGRCGG